MAEPSIQKARYSRVATFRITDEGELADVSLLSVGEALGHGLHIDEASIDTALKSLNGRKRLKAYIHHDFWGEDRLTEEAGYFEKPYKSEDGQRLMAERFVPFASFRKHQENKYDALMELAREMPEHFGVSLVFRYVPQAVDGMDIPAVRFREIFSADFVDQPAANPRGLFRIEENKTNNNRSTDMAEKDSKDELLELGKKVASLESERDSLQAQIEERDKKLSQSRETHANEVSALKEKHTAALAAERTRVTEIIALGKEHDQIENALAAVKDGKEVDAFKGALLDVYRDSFVKKEDKADDDADPKASWRERRAAELEKQLNKGGK